MYATRKQVLDYYAQQSVDGIARCACPGCGSTNALQLDHISAGGTAHRSEIKRQGSSFYRWVLQQAAQGIPVWGDYEPYCKPCNVSKSDGEACMLDHTGKIMQKSIDTEKTRQNREGRNAGHTEEKRVKKTFTLLPETAAWLEAQDRPMNYVIDELVKQERVRQQGEPREIVAPLPASPTRIKVGWWNRSSKD